MAQFLKSAMIIAAGVYVIILAWLYFAQRALLYHPDPARYEPADAGFSDMAVVGLKTADGLDLEAWYKPAKNGRPTILYFHGNAGSNLGHSWIARPLIEAGYGVLLLEYRGYGGNPGRPTEAGLYADGRAAIAFLKAQGLEENDIVLFGMSLGTGVAVKMAAEIKARALILQSPYTSIADAGQFHYWYLPAKWLTKDKFQAVDFIRNNKAPLLVVRGRRDSVIPPELSDRLFDAAAEPKTLKIIPGVDHNSLGDNGGLKAVLDFLAELP